MPLDKVTIAVRDTDSSIVRYDLGQEVYVTSEGSLYNLFLKGAIHTGTNTGTNPDGSYWEHKYYEFKDAVLGGVLSNIQSPLYYAIQEHNVKTEKANAVANIMSAMSSSPWIGKDQFNPAALTSPRDSRGVFQAFLFFFTQEELTEIDNNTKSSPLFDVMRSAYLNAISDIPFQVPVLLNWCNYVAFEAAFDYLGLSGVLHEKRSVAIEKTQSVASTLFAQSQSTLAEINKYNLE